ncbi:amino acid permease [Sinosporangium siamense]|uniref:amino acid permease n=1 Tax=Sinosporangium siamense TaxID=1367973 RepID=UPI001950A4BF|nr:amino acid permease [Sinosporangium siamense]
MTDPLHTGSSSLTRRLPQSGLSGPRTGARHRLPQVYGTADLVVLCLGVVIGAGIFTIAGRQAATSAGPGVVLSFMIAGIASLLAAMCWAELSSTMPSSGGAYTFAYTIFGEVWAWVIGWALLLEMQLAAAVVARVWSLHAAQTLADLGINVPPPLAGMIGQPTGFDLFTLIILVLMVGVVAGGTRLGLRALWVMVMAKMLAIGTVIVVGAMNFEESHLAAIPVDPLPVTTETGIAEKSLFALLIGDMHTFGWYGIAASAPAIAFAYMGFDIVTTAGEETADAPRTIPRGMIRGLAIATIVYIAVAVVMVGMARYDQIIPEAPLQSAFRAVGEDYMVLVVDVGAVLGLTTVILVVLVGQTRVLFAMARDGLVPRRLATLSRRRRSPARLTWLIGVVTIVVSQVAPVLALEQLVVIGTLFAFVLVAVGVIVMRRSRPDLPRGFRVPMSPLTPLLSLAASLWLLVNLQLLTWIYFALWMGVGLVVYLLYGRSHSGLAPAPSPRTSGRGRHRRHVGPVPYKD